MFHKYQFLTIGLFMLIIARIHECKHITPIYETRNPTNENDLKIMSITEDLNPHIPLDIVTVFNDASDVFRKIIGKMVANKRIIGLDSGWYW